MPPKKHGTIWKAEPHTIAKITILEQYLLRWCLVLGREVYGRDLLYVDGFAGPGCYTNHPTGSPIAALRAASEAIAKLGNAWRAGQVHCVFVENDRNRIEHLDEYVEPFRSHPRLKIHLRQSKFTDGIKFLQDTMPQFFRGSAPLFVFIDPFGPTGAPFSVVADILRSPRSEVLVNFDADGLGRILLAGARAKHEEILTEVFGDDSWRSALSEPGSPKQIHRKALELYIARLRSIPGVRYTFSFEMSKKAPTLEYYLVFASQHPRGLEKMKEAMKSVDQTGAYQFSGAHVHSPRLFRFDHDEDFAPMLYRQFAGQTVSYAAVRDFTLNETPFLTPKRMLKILEQQGCLEVASNNPKRKRGTFNEATIESLTFLKKENCYGKKK
jgi:hypothetical protein